MESSFVQPVPLSSIRVNDRRRRRNLDLDQQATRPWLGLEAESHRQARFPKSIQA